MIVTLPVAADYDVTGRTFPTGHMRVMPHTDMSALTLLFQRVGKPPRRFCAFVYAPCTLLCQSLDPTALPQPFKALPPLPLPAPYWPLPPMFPAC